MAGTPPLADEAGQTLPAHEPEAGLGVGMAPTGSKGSVGPSPLPNQASLRCFPSVSQGRVLIIAQNAGILDQRLA